MIIDRKDPSAFKFVEVPEVSTTAQGSELLPSDLPPPYLTPILRRPPAMELSIKQGRVWADCPLQSGKAQEVNQLIVEENKQDAISGSYILNCELPDQPINREQISDDLKLLIDEKSQPPVLGDVDQKTLHFPQTCYGW
ncbi:hypothetical protein EUX98_g5117 [Antrodiella citrinella]|uniref:Uncharacterized protein n=1 Tax=Antrodiella citrinella TaxID=2447956 RepID=A0A4S4MTA9_9APHY|nr:hypothetical protein EUX98_g5117 [Antrodiella citrinella]